MHGEVIITDQNGRIISEGRNIVFDFAQSLFYGALFGGFLPRINTISLFTDDGALYYDSSRGVVKFPNTRTRHFAKVTGVDFSGRKISFSATFKAYGLGAQFKGLVLHQWVSDLTPVDGLVLYLPFDEGVGTIAYDWSGYGNNGTLYNGPQWVDGKVGKALSFDGVDDYVSFLDDTLPLGNSAHTIIAWINPTRICSDCMAIFHYGQCVTNQLRLFFFRSNSLAGAFCGNDFTSGLVPTINTWQFAVWRWDNNTGKESIFLNQDKRERTTGGVNTPNLTNGYIGGIYANWYWQGLIDEVRIYNRALSDQEIKLLYYYSVVSGAVAYYPCDFYLNGGDTVNITWRIYL